MGVKEVSTYFGHQNWCLANLKSRIFKVRYLFVHVIDNLKVLCLFWLTQTLKIGWFWGLFLSREEIFGDFQIIDLGVLGARVSGFWGSKSRIHSWLAINFDSSRFRTGSFLAWLRSRRRGSLRLHLFHFSKFNLNSNHLYPLSIKVPSSTFLSFWSSKFPLYSRFGWK